MAAYRFSFNTQSSNCCTAAACSPARIINRMDTVVDLAVSIIVCLLGLRVRLAESA